MTLNRFNFIKTLFHVEKFDEANAMDPLFEIRYFMDYIINKWQTNYYPKRDLTIDETVIPYNNRYHKFTVERALTFIESYHKVNIIFSFSLD